MMKPNFNLFLIALVVLTTASLTSCNQSGNTTTDAADSSAHEQGIDVTPLAHSKQFPGAELQVASLTAEKVGNDSARITVKYNVNNFTLTEHTDDENAEHMANSAEGQHIHFILDNEPYEALYEPENSAIVKLGTEHYLLSFLSRSYHESIKEPNAFVLKRFEVDENGELNELEIPDEPALFYSRPKGEYSGKDTENILLDFYLVNSKLEEGHQVQAKINDTTIMLDRWTPYEITNAPKGELSVQLSLVDKDGNALSGENTSITRKVTLNE